MTDRIISLDAAIEAVNGEKVERADATDESYNLALDHAIEALSALPAVGGWLDIADWEPVDEHSALVYKMGAVHPIYATYDETFGEWTSFNGYIERYGGKVEPTHILIIPLPAPPD